MTSENDIERYRQQLLANREQLLALADTRRDAQSTVELDQTRTGRLSRMDALQGQAMARANQQRVEVQLRRIEAALRRCDDGSYGDCLNCDEPIDPRRLEVDPATPLCITCMQARER